MEALQQPSASLEALRQRKAAVETLLRQHQDLVARLDSVLEARKQNNKRMELPVDIGMGFTVEGIVNDTGRVVVAAGPQDLYLELEVGHARDFVEKRCKLLEKRLETVERPLAQAEAEHERVLETLKAAFEVPETANTA
ncbi:hypothetical protein JCM8202_001832 [Rhodotorula sphaerocarpa]